MIRKATHKDIEQLVAMAKNYYLTEQMPIGMDEHTLQLQIRNLMVLKSAALFVKENSDGILLGVVGGPLAPWPYDITIVVAQEYLVTGLYTTELRKEFYQWALASGARAVVKLCVSDEPGPRVQILKEIL